MKFILQNNVSVTFEILPQYPENPPVISVSTELINAERFIFENELRNLADKSVGFPMIMDLVIKLQQLTEDYYKKKQLENLIKNSNSETQLEGNDVHNLNKMFVFINTFQLARHQYYIYLLLYISTYLYIYVYIHVHIYIYI